MLIRVSGKLSDNRPFSTRIEASDVFGAIARAAEALKNANVTDVSQIAAKPLSGKSSISIGKARAPKAKKTATAKK